MVPPVAQNRTCAPARLCSGAFRLHHVLVYFGRAHRTGLSPGRNGLTSRRLRTPIEAVSASLSRSAAAVLRGGGRLEPGASCTEKRGAGPRRAPSQIPVRGGALLQRSCAGAAFFRPAETA